MTQNNEPFLVGLHFIATGYNYGISMIQCCIAHLTYPYTLYPVVVVSPPKNSSSMALRRSSGNCGPKPSLRWTPNQWGSKEHDGPKAFQQNSSNTNKSTKQVKDSTQAPFEPHYPRKTKLPVKKHGWNPPSNWMDVSIAKYYYSLGVQDASNSYTSYRYSSRGH